MGIYKLYDITGLTKTGLIPWHEIARNHLDNVVKVFQQTGTIWKIMHPIMLHG